MHSQRQKPLNDLSLTNYKHPDTSQTPFEVLQSLRRLDEALWLRKEAISEATRHNLPASLP